MSRQLKTVAKNASAVFATNILDFSFGFLILAIVTRYLGPRLAGDYFFIVAVAEILKCIADFGVDWITTREVARDREHAETLLGGALSLRWCIFGAAFLMELLVVGYRGMPASLAIALAVATVSQFFASNAMLFIAVYKGYEKMGYETVLTVILRGLSVLLLWLVARNDLGFIAVFVAIAFSQLVRMAVGAAIINRKFARVRLIPSLRIWKRLLGESYPLGLSAFFFLASFRVSVFVIKALGRIEDVSLFGLPHMVVLQLSAISSAIVVALFPVFSRLALSSSDALKVASDKSFKLIFTFSLVLLILIVKYAHPVVIFIGGAEFAQSAVSLRILGSGISFLFLVHLLHFILISADRQWYVLASFIICFSINLCLAVLLVPRWGYVGASWAMFASCLVFFAASFIFVCAKVVPVGWTQLIKPLLAAGPACLLLSFCGSSFVWGLAAVGAFIVTACILRVFTLDEVKIFGEALAHPPSARPKGGIP